MNNYKYHEIEENGNKKNSSVQNLKKNSVNLSQTFCWGDSDTVNMKKKSSIFSYLSSQIEGLNHKEIKVFGL